jgi:hypothetical protein
MQTSHSIRPLMTSAQIPHSLAARRLCLGRWQRTLLFGLVEAGPDDWTLTLVG